MFEGHDTTAAAMNWIVQEISSHPEIYKKCQDEVDVVFGDSERPALMEDCEKLVVRCSRLRVSVCFEIGLSD
jgi:cytochrome P450 family 4 subfamily V